MPASAGPPAEPEPTQDSLPIGICRRRLNAVEAQHLAEQHEAKATAEGPSSSPDFTDCLVAGVHKMRQEATRLRQTRLEERGTTPSASGAFVFETAAEREAHDTATRRPNPRVRRIELQDNRVVARSLDRPGRPPRTLLKLRPRARGPRARRGVCIGREGQQRGSGSPRRRGPPSDDPDEPEPHDEAGRTTATHRAQAPRWFLERYGHLPAHQQLAAWLDLGEIAGGAFAAEIRRQTEVNRIKEISALTGWRNAGEVVADFLVDLSSGGVV